MFSVLFAAWLVASPAAGDCKGRVDDLRPRSETIQDARIRELFQFDLKRAERELAEGDEDECTEAVGHAAQLLEMK